MISIMGNPTMLEKAVPVLWSMPMRIRGFSWFVVLGLLWPTSLVSGELLRAPLPGYCELRVPVRTDERPACWRLACPRVRTKELGCDLTALHQIAELKISADAAWLAILSVGEGHPILETAAVAPWIAGQPFKVGCELNPYPGAVVPQAWKDGRLELMSDVDLLGPADARADSIGVERRYRLDPRTCALETIATPRSGQRKS